VRPARFGGAFYFQQDAIAGMWLSGAIGQTNGVEGKAQWIAGPYSSLFVGTSRALTFQEITVVSDSLKKIIQQQMVLQRLDERLLIALFAPAVREGIFDLDDLSWQRSERSQDADKLIAQLLPLSEFYQQINPPLSAALWGIWNSVRYFRRLRSFLSIVFERKASNEKAFVTVRALAAAAAIQFSDGTAPTVVTSDALNNLAAYERYVEETIRNLSSLAARPVD
jgi:hypothetical protein